jgi:hypothetical protein
MWASFTDSDMDTPIKIIVLGMVVSSKISGIAVSPLPALSGGQCDVDNWPAVTVASQRSTRFPW